jgi:hypothetical protein
MLDRRQNTRDKMKSSGGGETGEFGAIRDRVVRNISESGTGNEFSNVVQLPQKQISPTATPKDCSFLAKIIWWRDSFVGLAFSSETSSGQPVSDLGDRVRKSEVKKRQLQRRIKQLLDEG